MENSTTKSWLNPQVADNIFFVIVGILICAIWSAVTGNIVGGIFYGSILGAFIWFLFKTPVGSKILDFTMAFFAWCGGVPRADLNEMSAKDQLTYARTGATLFVPTTLAFLGAFFVASDVYHLENQSSILASAVWAMIIFTIDAALVSTMKRDRNMKYSWSSLIIRFLLACALGILISSVLELRIFKKEIKQEFEEELEYAQHTIDSAERADIMIIQKKMLEEQGKVDFRELEMRKEMDQSIGGRGAGYGNVAKKKEKLWNDAKADFETNIKPGLVVEIQKIQQQYQRKRNNLTSNFSDGLASRLEYLHNAGKKHPVIAVAHFFLFLFLIAIELVPVLAKMMAAPTEYEHKKAQITAEAEIATAKEQLKAIKAKQVTDTAEFTAASELEKARKKAMIVEESARINAILDDMKSIHDFSTTTGKKLDIQLDVIANRLVGEESGGISSLWFLKKKGGPVA